MRIFRKDGVVVRLRGFTLVEIIIVVVVLAIAAALAIPLISSAADMQVRSAANMIAADLEYAKSLAISSQRNYSMVFDTANESYEIQDPDGSVISHPTMPSQSFLIVFGNDRRLDDVNIASANFDSTQKITFDYLGSPYNGSGNPLNSGQVVLSADSFTLRVNVEAVTGYVSIE